MKPADELTDNPDDYCLAKPGKLYAIYLPYVKVTKIDLSQDTGVFEMSWYNPRNGSELMKGSVTEVKGGQYQFIGKPPADPQSDWAVLLRNLKKR